MDQIHNYRQNEEKLILSMPFMVTSSDIDMYSRLRLGTLVSLLIQSANNSADNLEIGYEDLQEQKLFWVLSRLTLEIHKSLSWHQSGEVETWPKDVQKVLYIRDFLVKDRNKEIIARATSGWFGIDLETKHIRTIAGTQEFVLDKLKSKHALNIIPVKLFPVKEGKISEIKAMYFDIDFNGHVASSRYIDWMMDTFSIEFHQNNFPQKVTVNFLSETKLHDVIQLMRNTDDGKVFDFEGFNTTRNTIAFRGKIEF
ncbi:MAG: thioesterase [Bacteroidota bacterium]|nr:thioesterase [Bacteroidota bacterium]